MFENILEASLKICEYGKNNQQSYDYAFFINSNKDLDFVGWVIKTPCLFYFRSVKFHYVRETHDINSLLTLVKIVLASQHKRQPNKSLSRFVDNWKPRLGLWKYRRCTMQMSYSNASDLPFKNFCKLTKQAEAIRNSAKRVLVMIKHCLGISEINSILEWRVFLLNKRKSLRVQQPAGADIIHSNREIKEIFDPEKLTLSINSEHKSA